MRIRGTTAIVSAALLLTLAACGSDDGSGDSTKLTVYAAASLEPTFTKLGEDFEAAHDGVSVEFNFAGSSDLVAQLQQGAPADVFASADPENMDKAVEDDLVGEPTDFVSNTLQIAVPPDNPAGIESLADLEGSDAKVVVCAAEVPCGAATEKVEKAAEVEIDPVSEESSVTDVLNKVTTGEADAGVVYVTDVLAAGYDVKGVAFPESSEAVNVYPIAGLADSEQPELAQEFMELVTSEKGQAVLTNAGFGKP